MRKIILIMMVVALGVLSVMAEPTTKLGKSLSAVEAEVPGLRHLRNWPTKGDEYIIYHEVSVYTAYYFKNNRVVTEEFTCSGNQETASYYFDRFVADFFRQDYSQVIEGNNSVTFYFSRIKVTVSINHFVGDEYLCKVTYAYR